MGLFASRLELNENVSQFGRVFVTGQGRWYLRVKAVRSRHGDQTRATDGDMTTGCEGVLRKAASLHVTYFVKLNVESGSA